ncbi:hypothetical protein NPIL_295361 [Nephila pilipes]|uniref:Uncharacterized protein n=1 Tax=Nephila pilipes TaxID=299642 RepID=A0A8X6I9R2_NEPPI|nr:hypothetical protein NPIL_295361 [Nephila pilipes]
MKSGSSFSMKMARFVLPPKSGHNDQGVDHAERTASVLDREDNAQDRKKGFKTILLIAWCFNLAIQPVTSRGLGPRTNFLLPGFAHLIPPSTSPVAR